MLPDVTHCYCKQEIHKRLQLSLTTISSKRCHPRQSLPEASARRTVRSPQPMKAATTGEVRSIIELTCVFSEFVNRLPSGRDTRNHRATVELIETRMRVSKDPVA